MSTQAALEKIETFVKNEVEATGALFLVEAKIAPGNKVTVWVDGDHGITIDDCTRISKTLYKYIEETAVFGSENFSLEVSSPGVDKPLKLVRQYRKNTGREVEVLLKDGTRLQGKLAAVTNEGITIEEKKGKSKKMTVEAITILFNQIKHTMVLITF